MPKVVAKPTYEDARLLLELVETTRTETFLKARRWWMSSLPADPVMTLEEFEQAFPLGSDGQDHFWYVASFFETAGVLVRFRLLNEDLFFERFSVLMYWDRAKRITKGMQRKYDPALATNFEWLARRGAAWHRKHFARNKAR